MKKKLVSLLLVATMTAAVYQDAVPKQTKQGSKKKKISPLQLWRLTGQSRQMNSLMNLQKRQESKW